MAVQLPRGGKAHGLYLMLRDAISRGAYPDRSSLPSEQRLAEMHGVSRVTVRRALDTLAADGLIERRAGSGTRVCADRLESIKADFATLMPELDEMRRSTTARLLSFSYGAAPETVRRPMGLPQGATVQIATRVRETDGTPFSHLTTYVPEPIARHFSEADLATRPMFELLERSGVRIDGATQSVSATLAAPDVAQALGVSPGAALLSLHRLVRDSDGRAVEFLWALYRPDMFRLDMDLARIEDRGSRHWQVRIGTERQEASP